MHPRFLIAKYIPDLRRMEPRNIGVIVWADGQIATRFVGDEHDPSNQAFRKTGIRSKHAYRQWLEYWQLQTRKQTIQDAAGQTVSQSDPHFVDALQRFSKRQYFLVDGGICLAETSAKELAEDLFSQLVFADKGNGVVDSSRHGRELARATKSVVRNSGLMNRPDFYSKYPIVCPVGDTKQSMEFDYAIHDTAPRLIMTRVPLWTPQSVHSTAFRFQAMQKGFDLSPANCVSFVYLPDDDESDEAISDAYELMTSLGTVLNVAHEEAAANDLLSLVA